MIKRFSALVSGRVQGVGFRYFVFDIANNLELSGFVRNTPDGNVEVEAQGDENSLRLLIDYLEEGPIRAVVDNVHVKWLDTTDAEDSFRIQG